MELKMLNLFQKKKIFFLLFLNNKQKKISWSFYLELNKIKNSYLFS